MPKSGLDGLGVHSLLYQKGGVRVPKGMEGAGFAHRCPYGGDPYS